MTHTAESAIRASAASGQSVELRTIDYPAIADVNDVLVGLESSAEAFDDSGQFVVYRGTLTGCPWTVRIEMEAWTVPPPAPAAGAALPHLGAR